MTSPNFRTERDSLGAVQVPADAFWGAETQRAIENFRISGRRLPPRFIRALGLIKRAAAAANAELGLLPAPLAAAIEQAAAAIAAGGLEAHFPVDVFQTGSGTSTNMNANEVISHLAAQSGVTVHPNDHANMSQSSNDVVPTAIHVAAAEALRAELLPALAHLAATIARRESDTADVVLTGRTHLMDAMPLTLAQQLSGWRAQVESGIARLESCHPRLFRLAQGGTAVGTGINAPEEFAARFCRILATLTGIAFEPCANHFEAQSSQDTAVELSGQLRVVALALRKIAEDLRWMNSGPLAGLGEIELPALQPGSSIMPGKINPVICEAVQMVGAQVIGNDAAIAVAGQAGNFQLNTMLPLIASALLDSIELLAAAARSLADRAVAGFVVHRAHIAAVLERNPVLVTALTPVLGYERGAAIAREALASGRTVREVAAASGDLLPAELARVLDPLTLTRGGRTDSDGGGGGPGGAGAGL